MKKTILSILSISLVTAAAFAQIQPANANFDNWETLNGPISNTYEEPNDWNTSNECTALINQFSVTKSTDAYQGTHSARLESRSTSFQGVIANGVVTTAQMICLAQGGGQEGGSSYTDSFVPDSVVGWYKYTPANMDSAYGQIMFLANNEIDTVSFTRVDLHAAAEWTRFSHPITPIDGISPEKLSLLFSSSWGDGGQGEAEVGSILFIDDVKFVYAEDVSVGEELSAKNWSVYPNPAVDVLNVKSLLGEQANIEILDITGKTVRFLNLRTSTSSVDITDLVSGVYLYQIRSLENEVLRTGKLLVNH